MKKKYYILVLTLLSLFVGQSSYGQHNYDCNCQNTTTIAGDVLSFIASIPGNIYNGVSYAGAWVGNWVSSQLQGSGNYVYNGSSGGTSGGGYGGSSGGSWGGIWGGSSSGGGFDGEGWGDDFGSDWGDDGGGNESDGGGFGGDGGDYAATYYLYLNSPKDWYFDNDGDGWHSQTIVSINSPGPGWIDAITLGLDCDDNEPTKTIDCNITYYLDNDHDGYESATQRSLTSPGIGWEEGASMGIDCNDNDPVIRECIQPKPVEVINPATCRCIDPPNKSKFNNVTNVWNVLDGKKWILYQTNCNTSARKQNAESLLTNTTPVGAGMQANTFVDKKRQTESGQITPNIDMQKAIDIVIKNLKENKPVMAGVMYERYYGADPNLGGTPDDNNNVATNHYVTIVGMGIDIGKPYFSYYDNFVESQFKDGSPRSNSTLELIGTNTSENRFYYYQDSVGNYYFSDKTAKTLDGPTIDPNHNGHGFGNQYILTEIRDNY
ncbi:hypothetical protein [Flavobacterium sp.]|uniref:hypothetical protein n=1 Tax=Flavobacterium sp. TaxID=239 RepID=UPI0038FD27A0